jgi:hypothetical protein
MSQRSSWSLRWYCSKINWMVTRTLTISGAVVNIAKYIIAKLDIIFDNSKRNVERFFEIAILQHFSAILQHFVGELYLILWRERK